MLTTEFQQAMKRLIELGRSTRTAIMCAERLPWQCHRYLISESLVAHGVEVRHLIDKQPSKAHALSPIARVEEGNLVYNGGAQLPLVP